MFIVLQLIVVVIWRESHRAGVLTRLLSLPLLFSLPDLRPKIWS
jgi:hypothetical protein